MTPLDQELSHLVRIATRQPTDTDHSHKEWKRLVWEKANALAASSPADYEGGTPECACLSDARRLEQLWPEAQQYWRTE
jgi:hypothetical protein